MSSMDFLLLTKGPLLHLTLAIFVIGVGLRLGEIFTLGRRHNYALARGPEAPAAIKTVFARSIPDPGTWQRAPFDVVIGLVWHLCFFIVLFLFMPHVEVIKQTFGISWPTLPNPLINIFTVSTLAALIAALVQRIFHPVKRFLSRPEDYVVWLITFLPVLTGYLAYTRLVNPYPLILGLHILSVEILLVALPFTKLIHSFTIVAARWYNGAIFGRKGVQS